MELNGNGAKSFQQIWTLSTERAALWEEMKREYEETLQRIGKEM